MRKERFGSHRVPLFPTATEHIRNRVQKYSIFQFTQNKNKNILLS